MIIKRFASIDIGVALMITDALVAVSSFFVCGPETGAVFRGRDLLAKTLVIDGVIENFNLASSLPLCRRTGTHCKIYS